MIRDISPPLSGCQNGSAIRYGAPSTSQSASGSISNNIIDTYQKNGITLSNTGTVVTVTGNSVTGELPPPNTAQTASRSAAARSPRSATISSATTSVVPSAAGQASLMSGRQVFCCLTLAPGPSTTTPISGNDGGLVAVATTSARLSASGNTFQPTVTPTFWPAR